MEMVCPELWNEKNLKPPPIMTIKQNIQEKDGTTLRSIISEACLAFKNHSTFEQEAAFLSRFTYCMKTKLRHSKGLKTIAKVNQALLRYLRMNVLHQLETFLQALPRTYSDVKYMPSRNMLLYLLVRLQGFAKLMVRIVETSQVAASTLEQLVSVGHMWKIYFLAYGIVSRIYTLSRNIAKYACRLYSHLLPFVPVLQNSTVDWLPKSYILPKDLSLWLETDRLDDLPEDVPTDKPFLSLFNYDMGDSDEEFFVDRVNIEKIKPIHSMEVKPERTAEDLGIPILQNSNGKKRRKKKQSSKGTKPNIQTVDDLKLFEKDFKSNPEKYSDNFQKIDKMQCSMLHKLVLRCLKKSLKNVNNPVKVDACLAEVRNNSRNPYAKFLDKCIRSPIIVIPQSNKVDIIGPPNSQSNLRPIIRQQLPNETILHRKLRAFQDETQAWNEDFWSKHNTKFVQQKEDYVKSCKSAQPLSSDEMSQFYKKFLDDNWKSHVSYNFQWYKRNFLILYLALRVGLERFKKVSR